MTTVRATHALMLESTAPACARYIAGLEHASQIRPGYLLDLGVRGVRRR